MDGELMKTSPPGGKSPGAMAIDSRSRGETSVEYSRRRTAIAVFASTHSLLPMVRQGSAVVSRASPAAGRCMCTTPRSRADHRVVLNPIHGLLQAAERVEVETDVAMDTWIQVLQELVDQGRGTRGIQ